MRRDQRRSSQSRRVYCILASDFRNFLRVGQEWRSEFTDQNYVSLTNSQLKVAILVSGKWYGFLRRMPIAMQLIEQLSIRKLWKPLLLWMTTAVWPWTLSRVIAFCRSLFITVISDWRFFFVLTLAFRLYWPAQIFIKTRSNVAANW